MVQLNLMPAHGSLGEKVRVNSQTGTGKSAGARNVSHQPGVNLWHPFRYNILILTIIQATDTVSFIHSSLVNPRGLLSIAMLLARDQTF